MTAKAVGVTWSLVEPCEPPADIWRSSIEYQRALWVRLAARTRRMPFPMFALGAGGNREQPTDLLAGRHAKPRARTSRPR
jgi:hypothetical protein